MSERTRKIKVKFGSEERDVQERDATGTWVPGSPQELADAMLGVIQARGWGQQRPVLPDGRVCMMGAAGWAVHGYIYDLHADEAGEQGIPGGLLEPIAEIIRAEYPQRVRVPLGAEPLTAPCFTIIRFNDCKETDQLDVERVLEKAAARETVDDA